MKSRKKVNEVFSNWLTSGIFSLLENHAVPWKDIVDSDSLDMEYHGNISGDKYISPLVDRLLVNGELPDLSKAALIKTIFDMNSKNWSKMWETLQFEYNPIENYRMVENGTDNAADHNVVDRDQSDSVAAAMHNVVDKDSSNGIMENNNSTNSVWGFNSGSAVDSDKQVESNTVNGLQSDDIITDETNNTSETHTDDIITDNTHNEAHHLERSGNIGVTTSQQMIQSERDLWMFNYFRDVVFPAIDKIITLAIY